MFTWTGNEGLRQALKDRILPKTKDLYVESNGMKAKVRLYLPHDFDEKKSYPMIVNVYVKKHLFFSINYTHSRLIKIVIKDLSLV